MSAEERDASLGDYGFLFFLTTINVLNVVDRQLIASMANWIKPELNLTNTQFGLLTGLIFILFYAVAGVFMGVLADRVNRTRFIAIGLAAWSALTAVSGMAKGFVSLAIPRLFIGIGESIMTPTSMSILSDRFPSKSLGFASGFYYLASPIGLAVSLLIVAYLEPLLGWRGCFYALGALGIAFSIAMFFLRETPRRSETEMQAEVQDESDTSTELPSIKEMLRTTWKAFLHSPALMMTAFGAVTFHIFLGAAMFEQIWFVEERGFDRNVIAEITGWMALVAGIAGNLFGGLGSDYFLKKTSIGRPMFMFWIALFIMPVMLAYRFVDPASPLFMVCMFMAFFQLGCLYGPVFGTVQELVPPQIRGTVTAVVLLMINVLGIGFGVTSSGLVVDWLIAIDVDSPYTTSLAFFTVISFLTIPLFFFAGKRFDQDREALKASVNARMAGPPHSAKDTVPLPR
ncbi:MFS transporter [Luminiphilus sp.]|jgi:MFS family permease|nr:MFS transporter [Luminiphilus sp.]MDA9625461.1 MFS transporter [Luminiphilus sp.]